MKINAQNRRILVVDDNPLIHKDFRKILLSDPSQSKVDELEEAFFGEQAQRPPRPTFEIESAMQGMDGYSKVLEAIDKNEPYSVAFVDMQMPPGWNGLKTIREIWGVDPNIQVVICTAYSDESWNEICEQLGHTDQLLILKKPFDNVEVLQLATSLTEKWSLTRQAQVKQADLERMVEERTLCLKKAELNLRMQKGFLEMATGMADVGYWRLEPNSTTFEWSENLYDIFGVSQTEFVPEFESVANLHHDDEREDLLSKLRHASQLGEDFNLKSRIVVAGQLRILQTQAVCESCHDGHAFAVFGVTQDVTAYESALNEAKRASLHDSLTGLPNRTKFNDRLSESLKRTKRDGTTTAVMLLDIDHYKSINDNYGHFFGDEVLRKFSQRLRACVRETETIARLGGDEFAIIQSGIKSYDEILKVIDRIYDQMKEPFHVNSQQLLVGISMGVSVSPDDGLAAEDLLKNADSALYQSKESGRGVYRFFEKETNVKMKARRQIELGFQPAIEQDEFQLYYQPIFNAVDRTLSGMEALIRWEHPERGFISPVEFVPIAEQSGWIIPIGEWVINRAFEDSKRFDPCASISINVSAVQFSDSNFMDFVRQTVESKDIDTSRFEFEITESMLLTDTVDVVKKLNVLKGMGFRISMDDFGVGFSSLSYLKKFPFDRLKMDRSFVNDLETNRESQIICKAVASLGTSLGIKTTAEGIENEEQLRIVRDEGYTQVQGYLLGKPMPAEELMATFFDPKDHTLKFKSNAS